MEVTVDLSFQLASKNSNTFMKWWDISAVFFPSALNFTPKTTTLKAPKIRWSRGRCKTALQYLAIESMWSEDQQRQHHPQSVRNVVSWALLQT